MSWFFPCFVLSIRKLVPKTVISLAFVTGQIKADGATLEMVLLCHTEPYKQEPILQLCLVTWSLTGREAGVDLVFIQTSLLFV